MDQNGILLRMKKYILIIFLSLLSFNTGIRGESIFAVGGVEPSLIWRNLSETRIRVIFLHFNQPWENNIKEAKNRGEFTILTLWGPEGIRGILRLIKKNIQPDWVILINPGCVKLPPQLRVVLYPTLFKFSFPLIGQEWIREFVKWGFKPYSPTKKLLNSYIYYWSLNYREIPDFLTCPEINGEDEYRGKTVILKGIRKDYVKFPALKHLCPISIDFTIPAGTFFLQEEAPFYLFGIIKTIHKRRLR